MLTNAAGGVNPAYGPGQLVLISDHINLLGQNPLTGPNDDSLGPRFPGHERGVFEALSRDRTRGGQEMGLDLPEGVYAALPGPSYETPAEIRYLEGDRSGSGRDVDGARNDCRESHGNEGAGYFLRDELRRRRDQIRNSITRKCWKSASASRARWSNCCGACCRDCIRSDMDPLVSAALHVRENAHAPFSKFKVGAAVEDANGRIHTGCNIENATYGLTVCAERVAIFKAISEGARGFRRVAVVADTETLTPPCGACRQILWEFCGDIEIVLANLRGKSETLRLGCVVAAAVRVVSFRQACMKYSVDNC